MAPSTVRGAYSSQMSSAASYSSAASSKLSIVSRLAIEGKAKQGTDTSSVRMYLKLSVPADSVIPGQNIPLFPEENVRLRSSMVHPLDSDSVPYAFSSTAHPLLHHAARALNLPARSTKSYLSLFENGVQASPSRATSVNGSTVPAQEERYSGYFIVSGYQVTFVLPKEFPPRSKLKQGGTDSESDFARKSPRGPLRRRSSISERNLLQFMAYLDLQVPLSSKPPKAPYMLSMPLPRCLSNYIKFRLPAPGSVSTSFASLSSDEGDSGGWDVVTEPHVTRGAKPGRSSAYNEFADDESSEASTAGVSENCLVQGTFTSSDFIRIRWASPSNTTDFPDQIDGRRRVRVSDVKGNMTCTVLDVVGDGVKMRLDYQGACTGLWFPGVATSLGMDIILDAQGYQVAWPNDSDGLWAIDGDAALTNTSVDAQRDALKRQHPSQFEIPQVSVNETQDMSGLMNETLNAGRLPNTTSASLLRAPLPSRRISSDFSFENSVTPSTTGLPSSVPSMSTSLGRSSNGDVSEHDLNAPTSLFSLYLNMNELVPSSKNRFTFNVSGTVIVYRKASPDDSQSLSVALPFPVFRVYSAERESISQAVRSQCDAATVELDSATASYGSSVARTIVPFGSQMRCLYEDSVIVVRPLPQRQSAIKQEAPSPAMFARSPSMKSPTRSNSPASTSMQLEHSQQPAVSDGPSIIPWVKVDVVPLVEPDANWSYAVTLTLPTAGALSASELEFGLAQPPELEGTKAPSVEVIAASIDGVPVHFETFPSEKSGDLSASLSLMAKPSPSTWLKWIKVQGALVGHLELVYVVKDASPKNTVLDLKGKKKLKENVNILVPVFSLPIGRLNVDMRRSSDVVADENFSPESDRLLYRRKSRFNVQPSSRTNISMPLSLFSSLPPASPMKATIENVALSSLVILGLLYMTYLTRHIIGLRREAQELKAMIPADWASIFPDAIAVQSRAGTGMLPLQISTITSTVTSTARTTVSVCTSASSQTDRGWLAHTGTPSVPNEPQKGQSWGGQERPATGRDSSEDDEDGYPCTDEDEECTSWEERQRMLSRHQPHQSSRLVPSLQLHRAWPFHDRMERAKLNAMKGWKRVWRIVEIIINWPLPVEEV